MDNSKVDLGLKIDNFQILTRYIRKPHGGSDGYRSVSDPKNQNCDQVGGWNIARSSIWLHSRGMVLPPS